MTRKTRYTVFVRNWWKPAPGGGLEPNPGARRHKLAVYDTEEEAREHCRQYNTLHKPGRLSRKAEYTSNY